MRVFGPVMILFAAIVASACTDCADTQSSLRPDAGEGAH